MNKFYILLALIVGLMSCQKKSKKLAYVGVKIETNYDDNGKLVIDTLKHKIPEFALINQDNDLVTNEKFKGKVYVADFFFTTCPSICKTMSGNMVELQKMLTGTKDFHIVSHSVNPEYDSPKVLKDYADRMGAKTGNWDFLTGEKEAIYSLGLKGYFAEAEESELAPGGFLHTENFVLVDRHGYIRSRVDANGNVKAVYDGTNAEDIKLLYQDIKVLLKEK